MGVTLTAAVTGNPVLPIVTFLASVSSANGNTTNGEGYTNTEAGDLSNTTTYAGAAVPSYLTTYDSFTISFGGRSVTATLAANAITGAIASANIASTLMNTWNNKWSTGTASTALSAWETAALSGAVITAPTLKDSRSGGRFYGDTAAVTWTKATAAQASLATSGVITQTVIGWTIGSTEATTDNSTTGTDIILAVEETVQGTDQANRLSAATTLVADGTDANTVENAISNSFGLITNLVSVGSSAVNTGTTTNIFPADARGDVVTPVTAADGTDTTTGDAAVKRTRIHWLG